MKTILPIISIQKLFEDERLLKIIEHDLDKGISYKIEYIDGSFEVLKDSESLKKLLNDKNIK